MAYKMRTEGLEELGEMLRKMGDEAIGAASRALYEGAGIMADELKHSAEGIRTEPFRYAGKGETRLPSPEEKEIVTQAAGGIGISRFKKSDDGVQTSVGYGNAGYADLKGRRVPIPLIANSINSGTSFMQKQPFVRTAVNKAGKKAEDAMRQSIKKDLEKKTEG